MLRTRAAILDGAQRCIESDGVRKTTMSDVSSHAKVAKATLYNHFRTKDDLISALVLARIRELLAQCSELAVAGLAPALEHAGRAIGASVALRQVSAHEPAVAAALSTPGPGRPWEAARDGVETVLREAGAPSDAAAVDLVLRWLCGHVLWAATDAELTLGARVLAAGLGRAPDLVLSEETSYAEARPSTPGLGWPT
jgi:AcrR family transcriptional regulator